MTDVLLRFRDNYLDNYLDKYGPAAAGKGRRR